MENILLKEKLALSQSKVAKKVTSWKSSNLSKAGFYAEFGKRGFDLFISGLVMIFILSWLYPVIAMLIKLSSKGPVLFKQWRHGQYNKPFLCYKFRTMVENDEADIKQATKNDNRVTWIGKFLRATSMDELPQVLNVIKGEMSIVGPRPHAMPMNRQFSRNIDNYMGRHYVKPGITGLAQCKGFRGEIKDFFDIYSRYKLDMFYSKKYCLLLDIKIVVLTARSLLLGETNAY
ncbi:sugar transferase [Pleomorphovibrio marinus]|uniref:sugar transferase n=1 Tax=Pleomorphovibrio marinus TaxID=2164132 RepID=UPI000E0B14B4|nr:sugar transferase [Pleomorphovibrio marinus]